MKQNTLVQIGIAIGVLLIPLYLWVKPLFKPETYEKTPIEHQESPDALISRYFGKDDKVVRRIIQCESSWITDAISPTRDYGLLQIHIATAQAYNCENLLDPVENLKCGKKIYESEGLGAWRNSWSCWKNLE